jgi:hypothetical protein
MMAQGLLPAASGGTIAARLMLQKAGAMKKPAGTRKKRAKKSAATTKRARPRKTAGKKRAARGAKGRLKKGSQAAKKRMAALRAMQKRRR